MSPPILFTVLGGYLGSGKTTLLNHVLRHGGGERLAVIVNDFGSINIDASLIETRDSDMLTLANGCVCCTISAGLAEALSALSQRIPPPEHVVIEASGVADPAKIALFGGMPPYRLDGVVVLADAETLRARVADKYVGDTVLRQLRAADLVVLNKIDLLTETEQADLRVWLRARIADIRLFATSYGAIPLAMLLGLHEGRPMTGERDEHAHHHHGDEYASWSITCDSPIHEASFRASIEAWPPAVLRAKGILYLAEDPSRRHIFQLVGRRWSLTPDRIWGRDPPLSELVMIGLAGQLDGDALLTSLGQSRTSSIPN